MPTVRFFQISFYYSFVQFNISTRDKIIPLTLPWESLHRKIKITSDRNQSFLQSIICLYDDESIISQLTSVKFCLCLTVIESCKFWRQWKKWISCASAKLTTSLINIWGVCTITINGENIVYWISLSSHNQKCRRTFRTPNWGRWPETVEKYPQ